MKRLITGIGLLLLIACFWAAPAEATCYECRYGGAVCNSEGWCSSIYTCGQVTGFCSNCWQNCFEDHFGGYCNLSFGCQWAEKLPGQASPDPPSFNYVSASTLAP